MERQKVKCPLPQEQSNEEMSISIPFKYLLALLTLNIELNP